MIFRITTLSAAFICLLALPVSADVLLIDSINTAPINSEEGIPRPTRSMSMGSGQPALWPTSDRTPQRG